MPERPYIAYRMPTYWSGEQWDAISLKSFREHGLPAEALPPLVRLMARSKEEAKTMAATEASGLAQANPSQRRGLPMSFWLLLVGGLVSGIATTLVTWLAIRAEREREQEALIPSIPMFPGRKPDEKVEI